MKFQRCPVLEQRAFDHGMSYTDILRTRLSDLRDMYPDASEKPTEHDKEEGHSIEKSHDTESHDVESHDIKSNDIEHVCKDKDGPNIVFGMFDELKKRYVTLSRKMKMRRDLVEEIVEELNDDERLIVAAVDGEDKVCLEQVRSQLETMHNKLLEVVLRKCRIVEELSANYGITTKAFRGRLEKLTMVARLIKETLDAPLVL